MRSLVIFTAGLCVGTLLVGTAAALHTGDWYDVGDAAQYDKIRLNMPTRINNMPIEFSNSDSIIEGDSGSIWIATRDGNTAGTERKGLQVDHDGHSGIGAFDAANNWKLWNSERPDGPNAGDTIQGLAQFFLLPVRGDVTWTFATGTVTVTHTAHGYATDDNVSVTESGTDEVDTPSSAVTKVDADTYTYELSPDPTSSSGNAKAARIGDVPEFWIAIQDDAGVERRGKLGVLDGTQ